MRNRVYTSARRIRRVTRYGRMIDRPDRARRRRRALSIAGSRVSCESGVARESVSRCPSFNVSERFGWTPVCDERKIRRNGNAARSIVPETSAPRKSVFPSPLRSPLGRKEELAIGIIYRVSCKKEKEKRR